LTYCDCFENLVDRLDPIFANKMKYWQILGPDVGLGFKFWCS